MKEVYYPCFKLIIRAYNVYLLYYLINDIIKKVNPYLFKRLISRKERAYNSYY
jgi:hypothetical protein